MLTRLYNTILDNHFHFLFYIYSHIYNLYYYYLGIYFEDIKGLDLFHRKHKSIKSVIKVLIISPNNNNLINLYYVNCTIFI